MLFTKSSARNACSPVAGAGVLGAAGGFPDAGVGLLGGAGADGVGFGVELGAAGVGLSTELEAGWAPATSALGFAVSPPQEIAKTAKRIANVELTICCLVCLKGLRLNGSPRNKTLVWLGTSFPTSTKCALAVALRAKQELSKEYRQRFIPAQRL